MKLLKGMLATIFLLLLSSGALAVVVGETKLAFWLAVCAWCLSSVVSHFRKLFKADERVKQLLLWLGVAYGCALGFAVYHGFKLKNELSMSSDAFLFVALYIACYVGVRVLVKRIDSTV